MFALFELGFDELGELPSSHRAFGFFIGNLYAKKLFDFDKQLDIIHVSVQPNCVQVPVFFVKETKQGA